MRAIFFSLIGLGLFAGEAEDKRLREAVVVVNELMGVADKGIPQELLDKFTCAVVVPGLKKGAFILGAKMGRGFMICRNENGIGWGSPAGIRIEGGSLGFQIGASETDVIMLVKSRAGAEKLMASRFTLGGNASVAAGPVGRESSAQTDIQMRAEILSWSRSRGVFAGLSLQGATLREDQEVNRQLYGSEMTTKEVIQKSPAVPDSAKPLVAALSKYSGRAGK